MEGVVDWGKPSVNDERVWEEGWEFSVENGLLLPLCVEIQEWDGHATILFDTGDTVTAVHSILVKCVFAQEEYNICLA